MTVVASNPTSNTTGYPPAAIALHWIMAILIAAVFTAIELKGYYPKGSETRALLGSIHMMLGITVFLLVIVRIGVRTQNAAPPIAPRPASWQTAIAHLTHLTLYAAMIGMPLLGWTMVSAGGHSIPFYGLSIPPIIGEDKALAHNLEEVHEFLGNALYYVIGLHALAALAHHYLQKDNTLLRMLPHRGGPNVRS
ncbi:cytochrome b [Hyphomicrobium sp.]|uniref:cytochrome b n=1 Tax=Hyphomicrobium sp. TaxID=82 RepID=UPI003563B277